MSTTDDTSQDNISWNDSLEDMIAAEGEKCGGLAWLYIESERYYSNMNNYIALPVIVLSTVTGFLSGSSQLIFNNPSASSIGIGSASLFTGILSTIGSYFAWAKKTEGCRISALQYRKLQKFIVTEMTLPKSERIRAKDMLKMIRETVERLLETSPAVPEHIIILFNKRFKNSNEISHPEMTQGIAKVKINRALYDVESHNITRLESDGDGKPVVKITMGGV
jgi:hypothetical protein